MQKEANHKFLIVILAALSSVAPISTDTYIPSMPMIARYFSVGIERVELTLTLFLLGFAIGQLFGGAISDTIGRRKTSLLGLLGFSLFSFLIIFSTSIYELWLLRIIEAFFGGLVVVNANAIVRDKFEGKEAARMFTLIGMIGMIAPLIAPALGSFIIHFFSWKVIFAFLGTYALCVAVIVYLNVQETFVYTQQSIISSYKSVLTHTKALPLIIALAVSFAGVFIFITQSSFIYIEYFGVSTDYFPLFFGSDVLFVMIAARINLRFIKKYEIHSMLKFGLSMQLLIAIALVLDLINPTLISSFILLTLYISMFGFIVGNAISLILQNFPKNAAVATAVVGVCEFTLAALVASLVAFSHDGTLMPSSIGMFIASFVSCLIVWRIKEVANSSYV